MSAQRQKKVEEDPDKEEDENKVANFDIKKDNVGKEEDDRMDIGDDAEDAKVNSMNYAPNNAKQPKDEDKVSSNEEMGEKAPSATDNIETYLKMTGYGKGSPGKKGVNDAYYCDLQEFIDNTLKTIASKLSDKKQMEIETSSIKIEIAKGREDIKKEEQVQRLIKKDIEQELETKKKRIKENNDLSELLQNLQSKTEERKNEFEGKIAEMEGYYNELKEKDDATKASYEEFKTNLANEKAATREEIKRTEIDHVEAGEAIEKLKKQLDHSKRVEEQRSKMLQQKAKMLANLVGTDSFAGKSQLHRDISKILKTPKKTGSIMQSSSKSFSKT